jgi:subtilisin family serine protease
MIKVASLILFLAASSASAKTLIIAVIDTGIDPSVPHLCKMGHKSFVKSSSALTDQNGHGTHIAGLIAANVGEGDYCIVAIKYYVDGATGEQNMARMIAAEKYALNIKADFINISGGGPQSNSEEKQLIQSILKRNTTMVVAAGNEKSDLDKSCDYFPACYDSRIIVVGNLEVREDGQKGVCHSSNYGAYVKRWEVGTNVTSTLPGGRTGKMTGTSQATAVATGKLVKERLIKRIH